MRTMPSRWRYGRSSLSASRSTRLYLFCDVTMPVRERHDLA
jgi:hypothetical protein